MIKSSQILATALDLLRPEGAWCQGSVARTRDGAGVGASSKQACAWCIAGAVERTCAPDGYAQTSMAPALKWIRTVLTRRDPSITAGSVGAIANWQDNKCREHTEILDLVEEARVAALEAGD